MAFTLMFFTVAADVNNNIPTPDNYEFYGSITACGPAPETFTELHSMSDIIIRGRTIENVNQVFYSHSKSSGYTTTAVEVLEVFKGSELSEGDIFELLESYVINAENGKKTLAPTNGYLPSEFDAEYIFFLNKSEDLKNTYLMPAVFMGRYPVPKQEEIQNGQVEPAKLSPVKKRIFS